MGWLRALWAEIGTPSGIETDYQWSLVALGHAMIGAALASAIGWWAVPLYAVKEGRDLHKGGRWRDSAADMGFVALGCTYGPDWWPLAVFAAVLVGLIIRNTPQFRG